MKKLIFFIIFFLIFLFEPNFSFAADPNFDIRINATYTVAETGATKVSETVKIINRDEFLYVPSYSVNVGFKDIKDVSVYNRSGAIPFETKKTKDGSFIDISFPYRIVGVAASNEFTFQFTTDEIAQKKGTVWEVTIPGLQKPEEYNDYSIQVNTTESWGDPSLIKPFRTQNSSPLLFTKDEIAESGILLLYGNTQYFHVDLQYHLSNPNLFPITTEIAIPSDTSYQEVLVDTINPKPTNVYSDSDGNWLAEYRLSPQEELQIKAAVFVKMLITPKTETLLNPSVYTLKVNYWNTTDPEIQKIAQGLKTPEAIYDYVVKTLSYNYEKINDKNVRLGAKKVLSTPNNAVCLEFTDLFVTLARAAGIPARSVEGYAYTTNKKLRPVSLDEDILHAWPEYYDEQKKTWVMVDPTWGDTTGGIDYFNTLDFDHIAFVTKGKTSTYPIPAGGYKGDRATQDLKISFIEPSLYKPNQELEVLDSIPPTIFPFLPVQTTIKIVNRGNTVLPAQDLYVGSGISGKNITKQIPSIPPFGFYETEVDLGKASTLTNEDVPITISYADKLITKKIQVGLLTRDYLLILGGFLSVASIITFIIAIKAWRLHIQKREG